MHFLLIHCLCGSLPLLFVTVHLVNVEGLLCQWSSKSFEKWDLIYFVLFVLALFRLFFNLLPPTCFHSRHGFVFIPSFITAIWFIGCPWRKKYFTSRQDATLFQSASQDKTHPSRTCTDILHCQKKSPPGDRRCSTFPSLLKSTWLMHSVMWLWAQRTEMRHVRYVFSFYPPLIKCRTLYLKNNE